MTALSRRGSERNALLPGDCNVVEASLFDRGALAFVFENHEAVIRLATPTPPVLVSERGTA